MTNPAFAVPDAFPALRDLGEAVHRAGVPELTLELINMRASQINGCGVCLAQHPRIAKRRGETDERIWALAGWRDAPYYDQAERAALALTEELTRLSDSEGVSDEVWEDAAEHYDEQQLGAVVMAIASINVWNRLNVATRQVAGQEW